MAQVVQCTLGIPAAPADAEEDVSASRLRGRSSRRSERCTGSWGCRSRVRGAGPKTLLYGRDRSFPHRPDDRRVQFPAELTNGGERGGINYRRRQRWTSLAGRKGFDGMAVSEAADQYEED